MKQALFLMLLTVLVSCQPVNHSEKSEVSVNKLDKLAWMLGKWEMETPEGTITEEWMKPSDSQWQGVSYLIAPGGDTPFRERIRLDYSGDHLYYRPAVSNQNQGEAVSFAEKSFSDSLVVFENLQHDFPQRIIYKRISDTSILAAIEGESNGAAKREEFAYTRPARRVQP